MDIESFEKLVRTRQSCRSFSSRPVEREKIDKITELALLSPSACNSQPWSLVVLTDKMAEQAIPFLQHMGGNKFTSACPAFVAVVEEKANLSERLGERFLGQDFTSNDIGILVAHLTLAATAIGLSSCILGSFKEEKLKTLLGLGKKRRLRLVVALGYAADGYPIREKSRKTKPLVVYRDLPDVVAETD